MTLKIFIIIFLISNCYGYLQPIQYTTNIDVQEGSDQTITQASSISSKNRSVTLTSAEDITIVGSDLNANDTIALIAQDVDIAIKEAEELLEKRKKEIHGEAKVSLRRQQVVL